MNKTKIFIASSLNLKNDREELELFINRKNKELIKRNYFIELIIWEDFVDAISKTRLQDEYNKAIKDSDIFLMLFFEKVGKYTLEEFDVAYSQFLKEGKPKILTYHKRIQLNNINIEEKQSLFSFRDKLKEIEHFASNYKNIDDLKVQLYDYLEKASHILPKKGQKGTEFSTNLIEGAEHLNLKLKALTEEQFNVIKMLRHFKKVRISGCAGSGKTLVAIEKATRLSEAGLSTIIFCHSPHLAAYIKSLTKGKLITVYSFENWIYRLTQKQFNHSYKWSKYSEPTKDELNTALEHITNNSISFDAVIIDEGQDFRTEWWELIEAVVDNGKNKILYIFHDDNQALLPYRANYPIKEAVIDLSKNCRNAGEIYEYLRANLHHSAPSPTEELKGLGKIQIFEYSEIDLISKIKLAITWLTKLPNNNNIVILLAGDITFSDLNLKSISIRNVIGSNWKSEINSLFQKATTDFSKVKSDFTKNDVLKFLSHLSDNSSPTVEDIKLINELAFKFSVSSIEIEKFTHKKNFKNRLYWKNHNGKVRLLSRKNEFSLSQSEIILFFQNKEWEKGFYTYINKNVGIHPNLISNNYIPIIETSLFKGLESESVILIVRNKSFDLEKELYVAVSRAKKNLAILTDNTNKYFLSQNYSLFDEKT